MSVVCATCACADGLALMLLIQAQSEYLGVAMTWFCMEKIERHGIGKKACIRLVLCGGYTSVNVLNERTEERVVILLLATMYSD